MELDKVVNSEDRTERDLTTPLIIVQYLQLLHIVMTSLIITMASLVKNVWTAERRSRKKLSLENKPSDITPNKSASKPYSKDMLISNISVDNNAQ